MVPRAQHGRPRQVLHTVLLVGEGEAECCWARHLQGLFFQRGCGRSIKLKNAHGKGGAGVLAFAIGQLKVAAYDEVYALLDTDTDWGDAQRKLATGKKVQVIESSPCLEAWLLGLKGFAVPGDSAACKRSFEQRFGGPAHDAVIYGAHFSDAAWLQHKRGIDSNLDRLMAALGA